jgi:hypothetical protein
LESFHRFRLFESKVLEIVRKSLILHHVLYARQISKSGKNKLGDEGDCRILVTSLMKKEDYNLVGQFSMSGLATEGKDRA